MKSKITNIKETTALTEHELRTINGGDYWDDIAHAIAYGVGEAIGTAESIIDGIHNAIIDNPGSQYIPGHYMA